MMKLTILFFFFCLSNFVYAKWVWTPDTGWINTQCNPEGSARQLLVHGEKLLQQKELEQALNAFTTIVEAFPSSVEAEKSLLLIAEIYYQQQTYYRSFLIYEEYLSKYPTSKQRQEIIEKEYNLGVLIIQGKDEKRKMLGMRLLDSEELGIKVLDKVILYEPYGKFADDARLAIANYYFKIEDYAQATDSYNQLIKDHPKSEWLPFAQYQVATCSLKQFRGFDYDGEPLRAAEKKMEEYLNKNPEGKQKPVAEKEKIQIREQRAQKKLEVAKFYLKRDNEQSAKIYLQEIIKKFPDTSVAKQAKFMLYSLNKKSK